MKRQIWIERRRWRKRFVATCTRLLAATRCAVQRRKSSREGFTDICSDWDDTERQASAWIARLNADDVSSDDLARFEVWRNAHPDRARVFDELHSTWLMFTTLKGETDDSRLTGDQALAHGGFNAR